MLLFRILIRGSSYITSLINLFSLIELLIFFKKILFINEALKYISIEFNNGLWPKKSTKFSPISFEKFSAASSFVIKVNFFVALFNSNLF